MVESIGDRIRNAEVTAEDLKTALLAVDAMDAEDRKDFTGRAMVVMAAFGLFDEPPGQGTGEPLNEERRDRVDKVTATEIRLDALGDVVNDPKFKAWSFEVKNDDDDYIMMREDVLIAAAKTPLVEDGDGYGGFDIELFFENLLSVSEGVGKG